MSTNTKPSSTEEEYFAREESEKLRKLHADAEKSRTAKEKEERRKLHHNKCPKCGADLTEVAYRDLKIDRCFSCGAVALDPGELEHLAGSDTGYLKNVLNFFKS
jgi:hypothetical protein